MFRFDLTYKNTYARSNNNHGKRLMAIWTEGMKHLAYLPQCDVSCNRHSINGNAIFYARLCCGPLLREISLSGQESVAQLEVDF